MLTFMLAGAADAPIRRSTSSRNQRTSPTTGDIVLGPSAQIVVWEKGALRPGTMLLPKSSSKSRSSGRPRSLAIRYSTFSIQLEPSRHGVHLPYLLYTSPSPRDGLLSR